MTSTHEFTCKVHRIDTDGLPDMRTLVGRVMFLLNGALVSGWPMDIEHDDNPEVAWTASEDALGGPFYGITHWVELSIPTWNIEDYA